MLASHCHSGFKEGGIERNPTETAKWYRRAAEQGNGEAQYLLGHCYEQGIGVAQDYMKAVEWYKRAASKYWENFLYSSTNAEWALKCLEEKVKNAKLPDLSARVEQQETKAMSNFSEELSLTPNPDTIQQGHKNWQDEALAELMQQGYKPSASDTTLPSVPSSPAEEKVKDV